MTRLFIPGPVEVHPEILRAMGRPMIGHRTQAFSALYDTLQRGIQSVLFTQNPIYFFTTSATGIMESALRNLVNKKCLMLVNGAFSKRWYEIALSLGLDAVSWEVDAGCGHAADLLRKKLEEDVYDALFITHCETSTGVLNPLKELCDCAKSLQDLLICVDAVSSMCGVKIDVDAWGIDVCLASVQKAWGLPPGFALCSVSERALERSFEKKFKGYYLDFCVFDKYHQKKQTPVTPSLPHLYAMERCLEMIQKEGLSARFSRHQLLSKMLLQWSCGYFSSFAQKPYLSPTVSCLKVPEGFETQVFLDGILEQGFCISGGYGAHKGKTFRVGHMAMMQPQDLEQLMEAMDKVLRKMGVVL